MEKNQKTSLESLGKISSNTVTSLKFNGSKFTIKRSLSLYEVLDFVEGVVKSCFVGDEYHPELKNFAIDSSILEMYANCILPDEASKQYELVNEYCELIEKIHNCIDERQFTEIVNAINEKINYRITVMAIDVKRQIEEVSSQVESLYERINDALALTNDDGLAGLTDILLGGSKIDERKLVQAVFEERGKHAESEEHQEVTSDGD